MRISHRSSEQLKPTAKTSPLKTNEWVPMSYFHIVLLVLGIFSLCAITLILLATAIVHTGWWNRRRRIWMRRSESISKTSKSAVADQMRSLLMNTVDALAIGAPEDDKTMVKPPKTGLTKFSDNVEQHSLPLRFQPEKLYGATTTVHRENLRKGSCMNLGLPTPGVLGRRRSMFEGINYTVNNQPTEKPNECDQSDSKRSVSSNIRELSPQPSQNRSCNDLMPIPCATRRLSIGSPIQLRHEGGSLSDSKGEKVSNFLDIPLVTRRASSTDYELFDARITKGTEKSRTPIEITITDAYSDVDGPSAQMSRKSSYSSKQSDNLSDNTKNIRRNSFLSYYLLPAEDDRTDSDGEDNRLEPEISTSRKDRMQSHRCSSPNVDLRVKPKLELRSPIRLKSRRRESGLALNKLPARTTYDFDDYPAGSLAAELKIERTSGSPMCTITLNLIAGENLPSPRLWQKSSFIVKCTFGSAETSQMINCKDAELGCPRFPDSSVVSFESVVDRRSDRMKADINLKIFEHISKWSGEKDFFHGSVDIQLDQSIREGEKFDRIAWYPIKPAYPIIRLKGDLLVSLSRRQLKGIVSVGVHEIRNMEFSCYGKWKIDNIDAILHSRPLDLDVHACLIYGERIVKANKLVCLHQPLSKFGEFSQDAKLQSSSQSTRQPDKPKQISPFAKSSILTNGDYFTQFALPTFKKAFGKHLVSNHGIILLVTTKLSIGDVMPRECLQNLKDAGVTDLKTMYGTGECYFGDPGFQGELKADCSLDERNSNQGALFWNEAGSRGSNRVYQWLTMK